MTETINNLVVVILLLMIIWLVSSIRQTILQTPGPLESTKRIIRRAVGEGGSVATSRKQQPINKNLVPLDAISPDDAYEAATKFFQENK